MSLRTNITDAMKTALKAQDAKTLATVRLIMSALKDKDIAARDKGNYDGITDLEAVQMLQTMIKQRKDSIVLYEQGQRLDLVAKEHGEIDVIQRFLPAMMDDEAITQHIKKIMADTGASTIKDMGKIMTLLKTQYQGQMDFTRANAILKTLLVA
jgi:uncharacterized protein